MKPLMTFLILVSSTTLLSGCGGESEPTAEVLRPVRYVTVAGEAGGRTRVFTGLSNSTQESRLSFKVGGTVTELPIQVGDQLQKGDLVARLDASQYELQKEQAEAALVQAQASARNAEANYERVKGLYENSNASRNELDSARAASESAEAQVRAAQKQLELARLNVADSTLRLATECTIASVNVEVNENVAAGTQVALVTCGDELEVNISVPETLISSIREGMETAIRFSAIEGNSFAGVVTQVAYSARGDATFPVTIAVKSQHPDLRAGLAAEVVFEQGRIAPGVYLLPLSAVLNDPDGSFVYIAEPENDDVAILHRRPVTLGELTADGVEVVSGLDSGDRVVSAGTSVVRDGLRVRI
jgi:RND family efflux transporter MFP subunit